jgi:transcriptional regulator with XRE-family HTH domain
MLHGREWGHAGRVDRKELGATLKRARSGLTPADVELPAGLHRRVAGLRREEVAQLAGISVDYLVRLEQGRGPNPSESVIGALARTLLMTDDERDRLFYLAGQAAPRPARIVTTVRPSTLRLLERITDLPAMIVDAKGEVLAWNSLAAVVIGDFSASPPGHRNVAWLRFIGRGGRVAADPDEEKRTAWETVANLRSVAARYPDDPGLARLLAELRASPRFVELWEQGHVEERRSSRKTIDHPAVGPFTVDCDTLHVPDTDQRLIVYSAAPDTPEAEALAFLRVTQGLDESTPSRTPQA